LRSWRKRVTSLWAGICCRLGHRGAFLLALGLFDEWYALSIPGVAATGTPAGRWIAHVLPLLGWTALWAAAGVILIAGALVRSDAFAFATAVLIKLTWALVYLIGWAVHGVYRGWASAAVWLAFAAVVMIVSTWPEKQWPSG
jgi:hypothetical protein